MNQERQNFFVSLIKHFKALRDDRSFADSSLKILSSTEGADSLLVQIVGKNVFFRASAVELVRSDMLMSFSKADIAIISYLGIKEEFKHQQGQNNQPKLFARIVQQLLGKGGRTKFLLKMPEQEQLVEAVPEEVMMNKEALDMLSGNDAAMLGYAAAENRLMDIRRQVNQEPTCRIVEQDLMQNLVVYVDEGREARHTLPLSDIFNNKKLLNLFNKHDQQMISFAAGEFYQKRIASKQLDTLRLVSYSGDFVRFITADGKINSMRFLELAFMPDLLRQFNPKERDIICFAAGEVSAQEKLKLKA